MPEARCYCGRLLPRMPRQVRERGHGRRGDYSRGLAAPQARLRETIRRAPSASSNSAKSASLCVARTKHLSYFVLPQFYGTLVAGGAQWQSQALVLWCPLPFLASSAILLKQ